MQPSDFIASVSLIISLYSLWLQNKGVQKQLLVANISAYTKRYQEIFDRFPKYVLDENFKLDSLSEEEQEQLLRTMCLYFDLCSEEYMLYHDLNLIDERLWSFWESGMKTAFSRTAFCQCWDFIINESFYSKSFSKFVNNKMIGQINAARII